MKNINGNYLLISRFSTEDHPDKMANQISDVVFNNVILFFLRKDG